MMGPPRAGKASLLRDVARLMSSPTNQGGLGLSVLIVDTTSELAGANGLQGNAPGCVCMSSKLCKSLGTQC